MFFSSKDSALSKAVVQLKKNRPRWLITGVAGFIGSNLLEALLRLDQEVVGLDNFSTGSMANLEEVKGCVPVDAWRRFSFLEGDIRDLSLCRHACSGIDIVLHQAALGSVPRSLENPILTNGNNIDGFLNMLVAAKDAGVGRFLYAASSSTYGDHEALPKIEGRIGKPLSPYAVTKLVNELYAEVFSRCYGLTTIGLRYFNIFGRRQDPDGAYAAVIPKWISSMIANEDVFINGDGCTSRDFCYIDNAIQANLLAAVSPINRGSSEVFNVAVGERITLKELFNELVELLKQEGVVYERRPVYREFRPGDVRHSQADIGKAKRLLGYEPFFNVKEGLGAAVPWYLQHFAARDNEGQM